jgi:hypothetical protein
MALASWHDDEYQHRTMTVETAEDLHRALAAVLAVRTPLGHPTLTVSHGEDNALTVATDGSRAMLVQFIGTDGDYRNSAGGAADGDSFVFDYEGHWSEAAPESVVTLDAARDALVAFLRTGSPTPSAVRFDKT